MTPYEADQKARAMIHERPTANLITDFELTELLPPTMEVITLRGWIMDELEARSLKAFEAWIDSEEESPRKFFKAIPT
jgi:hypothetical protein